MVEHQPFLLDVWRALSLATCNVNGALPGILTHGVRTGILHPIQPSGVWEESSESTADDHLELLVHY